VGFFDMADTSRAGEFLPALDRKNILRRRSPPCQRSLRALNYVIETECSTGTCVLRLLKAMEAKITPEIATCLLTTILTDTGGFMHSNTTADVLRISAELIDLGADRATIVDEIYANKRFAATK